MICGSPLAKQIVEIKLPTYCCRIVIDKENTGYFLVYDLM